MKFLFILAGYLGLITVMNGQDVPAVDTLDSSYAAAKTAVEEGRAEKITKLFEGYTKAIERIEANFRNAGDLDNTLKIRKEIERVKTDRTSGNADFKGAEKMRDLLSAQLEKIDSAHQVALRNVNQEFHQKFEALKVELTKQGSIEAAMAAAKKASDIAAAAKSMSASKTAAPKVPTIEEKPATGAGMTIKLIDERVVDTRLSGREILHGDIKLKPGHHLIRKRVIIGDGRADKGSPESTGTITIPPGSLIEKEAIYVDNGEVIASSCVFHDMFLTADLSGKYTLSDCLIDDVVFKKEGGWFSGYSAKFEFKNCVLRGSHFERWTKPNIGVKITNSTFLDAEFEAVEFKDDAGLERGDGWRTIENCRFINCSIPQSVLLITKNCVFENCKFGRDERLPGQTKSDVTLYYDGIKPSPPTGLENVEFKIEPASALSETVGSNIAYDIKNNTLVPRN